MTNKHFIPKDNALNQERLTQEEIPQLEDGEWILIKKKLTTSDWEKHQQQQFEWEVKAQSRSELQRMQASGQNPVDIRYKASTAHLLSLAILDWSFTDEATGEKIPITLETLGQMDWALSQSIQAAVDARNPI